jgi:sugar/nucleoside kinase (ribokinase family)
MASARPAAHDVVAIGNAIVDVLAHADESFLAAHGMDKGIMTLIDADRAEAIYQAMGPGVECSGGSAANTAAVISSLGGSPAYIGKVKDDILGTVFRHDIERAGVAFSCAMSGNGTSTARCLILVTGDGERTMNTYLGACRELTAADIDAGLIADSRVVYLEGYLWDEPAAKAAMLAACRAARAAGREVAMSLSDPFCVHRHRAEFQKLVKGEVDVLFANQDEAIALFEAADFDAAVDSIRPHVAVAAITRGAAGCVVISGGETLAVAPDPVAKVVDTTGAGDAFAAGFLRAYTQGHPLSVCGRLGNLAAGRIITHFGARPERPMADLYARATA